MRICRYNDDKLGLIKGDQLIDVTIALDDIPKTGWPRPHGDGGSRGCGTRSRCGQARD